MALSEREAHIVTKRLDSLRGLPALVVLGVHARAGGWDVLELQPALTMRVGMVPERNAPEIGASW